MKIIVGIKDNAVEGFIEIFAVPHTGLAMRNFADAVNDPNNKSWHQHPEDYELWRLGTLDESTGQIESKPERLSRGQDTKRS